MMFDLVEDNWCNLALTQITNLFWRFLYGILQNPKTFLTILKEAWQILECHMSKEGKKN